MIDITAIIYEFEECDTQASFNYKGCVTPKLYSMHKEKGMINLSQKYCVFKGCDISALFNYDYCTQGKYCATHK